MNSKEDSLGKTLGRLSIDNNEGKLSQVNLQDQDESTLNFERVIEIVASKDKPEGKGSCKKRIVPLNKHEEKKTSQAQVMKSSILIKLSQSKRRKNTWRKF